MSEARLSFEVGRLLCGDVRDWIARHALLAPIRHHEGRGFWSREFTIVGPSGALSRMRDELSAWVQRVNAVGAES